jgi:hypothetical protein
VSGRSIPSPFLVLVFLILKVEQELAGALQIGPAAGIEGALAHRTVPDEVSRIGR